MSMSLNVEYESYTVLSSPRKAVSNIDVCARGKEYRIKNGSNNGKEIYDWNKHVVAGLLMLALAMYLLMIVVL
jgi:hypothetical protein